MTLEEKIRNIHITSAGSLLCPLPTGTATDIQTFWKDVVEPMLPDYDTMKKWHELLKKYVSQPDAVFMLRKGNDESQKYQETVAADALRRGFLTKTDCGYWFVYNDNDFATLMLAMVLDGDIVDSLDAKQLLSYLQQPQATIRFNRSGKGGVEKKKAYYKISGQQPCISPSGYTVAHIFDVNNHYYDTSIGLHDSGGEEALQAPNIGIDRGLYSDYTMQGKHNGIDVYFRDGYHVGPDARKFLAAHMLRYLHPLNYFCAPKDNMNGRVYCEFTDRVHKNGRQHTNRRFRRISGYQHLLYYAHHKFKEKYRDIYDEYLKMIMLPADTFAFFEKCAATETTDYYGSEVIDVMYGNPLFSGASTTSVAKKVPATSKRSIELDKIVPGYLEGFKVGEIANQVLRVIIEEGAKTGKITKSEIVKFKTEKGKRKSTFMITKPLLSPDRLDKNGYARYYQEPISCYGEMLYLYKDWDEKDAEIKGNLIQWILNWMAANGGKIL